jgi:translocation and assembly module TamB
MRLSSRKWKWLGVGLAMMTAAFFVVRTWVVPSLILGQLQANYRGKVSFESWWFGLHSAGITGLKLGETRASDSPVWFSADRISTNVSIERLIRGQVMPTQVEVDRPEVTFHLDAKGQPLTKIPLVPSDEGKAGKAQVDRTILPDILTKNGVITLQQDGRKPMTIRGVDARLSPVDDGAKIEVKTDDPTWGQVTVSGHFDPSFKHGNMEIKSSPGFVADPDKLERIPFIPAEVWANLEPRGPVDALVHIKLDADAAKPVVVHTEITLEGTNARLNTLQVESTDTHGHIVIDDALVKVLDLKGKTLDGTIAAAGILDFGQKIPRIDLDLRLKNIDATKTPPAWQFDELGATGRLSGKVDLKVALRPKGPDLTGTDGRAVIEDGSFQGIRIKSLSLALKASGNDLQYQTLPEGSFNKDEFDEKPGIPSISIASTAETSQNGQFDIMEPVLKALPIIELAAHDHGLIGWVAFGISELLSLQIKEAEGKEGGFRLPKTISTQIELADVDLITLLEKAKKYGIVIPVPVAGRFSLKASATIPLGALKNIQAYRFQGDATLMGASIDHVDLGLVAAHLELVNGVLELSDFRGQFVEKAAGTEKNPPPRTASPPSSGPLPAGAFRGHLKASIAPRGDASATFEGNQLPIAELLAPVLPIPTPVSGETTLLVNARANLANLADMSTYQIDGHFNSRRIKYTDAVLDEIATDLKVEKGRVEVSNLTAKLLGKPLKASGGLDLAAPYRYSGVVTIDGWEIAKVLGFVPGVPKPAPVSGSIAARAEASGSLTPFAIQTRGAAKIVNAKAAAIPAGTVAFHWITESDEISLTGLEIDAFGGQVTGEARIPTKPGRSIEASATLKKIDSALLAATFLGNKGLQLGGVADGKLKISMPLDASVIIANATLESPRLEVRQGLNESIVVDGLKLSAIARDQTIRYEATAESLGARVRFRGSAPIATDLSKMVADAEFQAAGFRLGEVWKSLGMVGGLAKLDGLGAFNANIRAKIQPFELYSRGIFEFRDLHYGNLLNLGTLSGNASLTPKSWGIDQVRGELLGGLVSGEAHSETRTGGARAIAFDFKVDRASLAKMTTAVPLLAREVEGYGSFKVAGRVAEALQASGEVLVSHAKIHGIPMTDLRFPAELEMNPDSGVGSVHSRHWTARMAGGSVRGSAWIRLGTDRTFQSDLQVTNLDLEAVSRLQNNGKRPPSGRLSGKISLTGPHPDDISKMRGKIDVDLDDASLVELPVFKELDRFLGSARGGGLFEDGSLLGTIFNRTLFVEQLTLKGKLIQIHATGSVTLDGGLNLEVLVNTNQVIPQSGLALVNIIPGLGTAIGRSEEVLLRLASFLENRLLKFRVSGTMGNPVVQLDPGIAVGDTAVGFFSSILKVPNGNR